MTISELGSLGEVIGAVELIVTLVFLAMEMRLKRKDESFRDIEQSQIRSQEFNLAVATSPSLCAVMAKWHKLTGGHFQPLPPEVSESTISDLFTEEERAALVFYFYANAMNFTMILAKFDRGSFPEANMRHHDSVVKEPSRYFTVFGNLTSPRRLGERFSADLKGLNKA
ncbi:MAG: hypothetical protein CMM57_10145 [Rhodospirillaceae bacterium]|nr:hypothetical protein [Rhodospirillaceae bacterium]|tara:strand:+ start:304 stop:810 length:507 start_codon:yes stop_codon:yes gene_type:complete